MTRATTPAVVAEPPVSRFFRSPLERIAAALGLLACSPVLVIASACTLIDSGWPVLFCQTRVGRYGTLFKLLKFRSMRNDVPGACITKRGDGRITRVGAFLRRYKIDELPQLWNILLGQMQFVGPRPELPSLVDPEDPVWRAVLSHKPGLTDLATLLYRNEEEILSAYSDSDRAYQEDVLPKKLLLSAYYQQGRGLATDLKLLLLTARFSFFPAAFDPDVVMRLFVKESSDKFQIYPLSSSIDRRF
jgi:lipopolysaccharide/colanic/teichoic acid biosynthesis glycosyltransferase